ncbi:hypothetical protein [Desulfitobacterium sp.]|uniref:hypothetical protein n=1 Tax=Desulfitobacterium sp. TaxID=49981 RepID=UPI002CA82C74|nr:hypothetical protein [Desulfitobacterium sp.]HVJ48256.1 hypothetical protein [Desulfitobacterium sp.]
MKRTLFRLTLMTILSSLIFLSGCGASKTSSTSSSKQTTSANSATQTQNQSPAAATPSTKQAADQSSTPVGPATALFPESMNGSWVDAKSDVLSPIDGNLDGVMDGHFHLTLQLPQPVSLESIFIRYSEFGKELRWDWIYNNHLTPAGYNLGVYEQGNLIPLGPDTGIKRSGQVELDLFVAGLNNAKGRDTFSFNPGSNFQIELNYTTQAGELKKWSANITSQ